MKAVLTIAGSDSSGGAGIQADLKTIAAHHLFGESVITALTAQNTLGVTGVLEVDPVFVGTQIDAVFDDIRPDAVKIGMVSSPAIVGAIADGLDRHKAANVVVDPVMVATSGSALIADAAVDALVRRLFPRSTVITPNIPEAEVLSGMAIASLEDVETAASLIADRCIAVWENEPAFADAAPSVPAILIKGGHGVGEPDAADDYLRIRKHLRCKKNSYSIYASLYLSSLAVLAWCLAYEYVVVAYRVNVDLASWQESLDTEDVNDQYLPAVQL